MRTTTHDVLVIGAGLIGSSIAYYLSCNRANVGVLERGFAASGTSGATVALVAAATRDPVSYARFVERSKDLLLELTDTLDLDIHYDRCGELWIFRNNEMMKKGKAIIRRNRVAGLDTCFVDRKEIEELEPALSTKGILGAAYSATDGHLDPFALVRGLNRKANEQGAKCYFHTDVRKLSVGNGRITVQTSKGPFESANVVVAAGVWSPLITQSLGIGLPLRPVRGQILVTQPMPRIFDHVVSPGISQDWRGSIILGFCSEEVGYNNKNTLTALRSIAYDDITKSPLLRDLQVIRSYSGLRPMPFDEYPLLDKLPGYENVYVAAVHSGVGNAQIIGKSMAEWITEGESGVDLSAYSLTRDSLTKEPKPYRAGEESYYIGR